MFTSFTVSHIHEPSIAAASNTEYAVSHTMYTNITV